jgi:hypothetical protein
MKMRSGEEGRDKDKVGDRRRQAKTKFRPQRRGRKGSHAPVSYASFQNLIVTKKSDPSDPVKFHKIRYNSTEF